MFDTSSHLARHRVLSTKECATFCNLSVATVRRMTDKGSLPKPIRLSERRLGYRACDLIDWLDCRAAGREWRDCKGSNDNIERNGDGA